MKHLRIMGLALVAVIAVAAVAAATASAASPEWGQCYAKTGGKYEDANCQTKAKGKTGKHEYEWRKASEVAKRKFTGEGGASVLDAYIEFCKRGSQNINPYCEGQEGEDAIQTAVECTSENAGGEVGAKGEIKNVEVRFRGCKLFGNSACQNTAEEGEVVVNILTGKLGYIDKATKEVGVVLNPAIKKGEFAKFTCAGTLTTIVGVGTSEKGLTPVYPGKNGGGDGIISPITPVDQMSATFTQVYTINAEDENIPSHFEGKPNELLEAYVFRNTEPESRSAWSKAGEQVTNVNTGEEEVEIKA